MYTYVCVGFFNIYGIPSETVLATLLHDDNSKSCHSNNAIDHAPTTMGGVTIMDIMCTCINGMAQLTPIFHHNYSIELP